MGNVQVQTLGVGDLHNAITERMVNEAEARKVTVSQILEEMNPSDAHDEYSAFERQIEHAGIVTRTSRSEGYKADRMSAFDQNEATRILGAEWIDRQYRSVGDMDRRQRRQIGSDLSGVDMSMRPVLQAAAADEFVPAVPLSEVVAFTTSIDGDSFRALYVDTDTEEMGYVRVGQGAPLPEAKLTLGSRAIDLYKFGRAITVTYEAMRRLPIDTAATYIRMAALQVEMDKVARVASVMQNGDGNDGTEAEVVNLTDLDPDATAGTLTLKAWAKFKLMFGQPYILNTELVREDVWLEQLFLEVGEKATLGTMPATGLGGFTPINGNMANDVAVGVLDTVPQDFIIGFDRRFAVQRVVEAGSNITESFRWIRNQTQELTFSENEGYARVQPKAARILNIGA